MRGLILELKRGVEAHQRGIREKEEQVKELRKSEASLQALHGMLPNLKFQVRVELCLWCRNMLQVQRCIRLWTYGWGCGQFAVWQEVPLRLTSQNQLPGSEILIGPRRKASPPYRFVSFKPPIRIFSIPGAYHSSP